MKSQLENVHITCHFTNKATKMVDVDIATHHIHAVYTSFSKP